MRSFSRINQPLASEPDPAFARRAKIILKNLEINGREKVLDLGCGRGFYLQALATLWPKLRLTGVDLNGPYLEQAKKNLGRRKVSFVRADATKLPFKKNFFDRVIASEILEHVFDDMAVLREIYRVLKPGGVVVITVPNRNYPFFWDPINWILEKAFKTHLPSHIWWLSGIWADHQRLYSARGLKRKLKKAKLSVRKVWQPTFFCLPFAHFLFYALGKNLVEKGWFKGFNRFESRKGFRSSPLNKILLWPVRLIDRLNGDDKSFSNSVNIILKAKK